MPRRFVRVRAPYGNRIAQNVVHFNRITIRHVPPIRLFSKSYKKNTLGIAHTRAPAKNKFRQISHCRCSFSGRSSSAVKRDLRTKSDAVCCLPSLTLQPIQSIRSSQLRQHAPIVSHIFGVNSVLYGNSLSSFFYFTIALHWSVYSSHNFTILFKRDQKIRSQKTTNWQKIFCLCFSGQPVMVEERIVRVSVSVLV